MLSIALSNKHRGWRGPIRCAPDVLQITGNYLILVLMLPQRYSRSLFCCYYKDWFFPGAQDEALRRVICYYLAVVWLRYAVRSAAAGRITAS